MTNREAFNKYLREEIEKAIAFVEAMPDRDLVEHTCQYPNFSIEKNIGTELSVFKVYYKRGSVGKPEDVIAWLAEEWTGGKGK